MVIILVCVYFLISFREYLLLLLMGERKKKKCNTFWKDLHLLKEKTKKLSEKVTFLSSGHLSLHFIV